MCSCICCPGKQQRYSSLAERSTTKASVVEADDMVSEGFLRSPPAVLATVQGAFAGRQRVLSSCGWEVQKWQLGEDLLPIGDDERGSRAGLLLVCVNGSFAVQALNLHSELWLHVDAASHGPGCVRLGVGDLLRIAGCVVRVETVPRREGSSAGGDRAVGSEGSEGEGVSGSTSPLSKAARRMRQLGAGLSRAGKVRFSSTVVVQGHQSHDIEEFHLKEERLFLGRASREETSRRSDEDSASGDESAAIIVRLRRVRHRVRPPASARVASAEDTPSCAAVALEPAEEVEGALRAAAEAPEAVAAAAAAAVEEEVEEDEDADGEAIELRCGLDALCLRDDGDLEARAASWPPSPSEVARPLRHGGAAWLFEAPSAPISPTAPQRGCSGKAAGAVATPAAPATAAAAAAAAAPSAPPAAGMAGAVPAAAIGLELPMTASMLDCDVLQPAAAQMEMPSPAPPAQPPTPTVGEEPPSPPPTPPPTPPPPLCSPITSADDWPTIATDGTPTAAAAAAAFAAVATPLITAGDHDATADADADAARPVASDDAPPASGAAGGAPGRCGRRGLCVRVACAPTSTAVPMGAMLRLGGTTLRLARPHPSERKGELWARLAVGLDEGGRGALSTFLLLPQWSHCNYGIVGRRSKRATLPLRDLKARRRHALLVLRSFDKVGQPLPRALPAPCFQLMPHKGKPCQLLLGRATQTLRQRWRLTAGDVFCVGHTHVSVQALTQRVAAPHGARLVLVHDRGRRYRRKALKEKKRSRKLLGNDNSSSDDDDDAQQASSDDDASTLPDAPWPLLRLLLVAGPMRGRTLELGAQGVCIGSAARCDLELRNDRTVSSVHARINCVDGHWYLSDVGSATGTFLLLPDAGSRIDIGDVVRIGKTEIAFFVQPVEPSPQAGATGGAAT